MDLVKACSKALVVAKPKGTIGPSKKKVTVLDEEAYTEVNIFKVLMLGFPCRTFFRNINYCANFSVANFFW